MKYDESLLKDLLYKFLDAYEHIKLYRVHQAIKTYKEEMLAYMTKQNPENPEGWSGFVEDPQTLSLSIFCRYLEQTVSFNTKKMETQYETEEIFFSISFISNPNRIDNIIKQMKEKQENQMEIKNIYKREELSSSYEDPLQVPFDVEVLSESDSSYSSQRQTLFTPSDTESSLETEFLHYI